MFQVPGARAGTADALKGFFANACQTAKVQPPLSALYSPTEDYTPGDDSTTPPTCHGAQNVSEIGAVTVCRDSAGLLEAAFSNVPGLGDARSRNEYALNCMLAIGSHGIMLVTTHSLDESSNRSTVPDTGKALASHTCDSSLCAMQAARVHCERAAIVMHRDAKLCCQRRVLAQRLAHEWRLHCAHGATARPAGGQRCRGYRRCAARGHRLPEAARELRPGHHKGVLLSAMELLQAIAMARLTRSPAQHVFGSSNSTLNQEHGRTI